MAEGISVTEGAQNRPWALGTLFYKGVKIETGENWSHKTQVLHSLFSVYFLSLFNSVNKKMPWLKKYWWGICLPLPPPRPKITRMAEGETNCTLRILSS
jgi:hypothetical protein